VKEGRRDEKEAFENPNPDQIDPKLWDIFDQVSRDHISDKLPLVKPDGYVGRLYFPFSQSAFNVSISSAIIEVKISLYTENK
jgi:hypothetical protein